jgi:hypothetical protein
MSENKIPENYISGQTMDEVSSNIIIQLEKDKLWCEEERDNWAKIQSYDLTEKIVIFNLGVLAFTGAISQKLEILNFSLICIFSLISIILSFYIMCRVSNKNTKLLNDKAIILSNTIIKISQKEESLYDIISEYQKNMIKKQNELILEISFIEKLQIISISLFIIAVIVVMIDIIFPTFSVKEVFAVLGVIIN